ncbi:MAG: hypothetical protein NTY02_02825, partial [Acidobacteria bacterium]|nr:hypothetical protein [Acidobacteriota bacterium]
MRQVNEASLEGLSAAQRAAVEAIRSSNVYSVIGVGLAGASSAWAMVPPDHRLLADSYDELVGAFDAIGAHQARDGSHEGGLLVLSGHSIALAAYYLEHPGAGTIEWMTVGRLSLELRRRAPAIGWVLLNLCFPTAVLESRRRVPARLVGREGKGWHAPAPRGGPRFVAPHIFGSCVMGQSVLAGGRKPVTDPLVEMLADRVTNRAFVPRLAREEARTLVKGDDRLYERLDESNPHELSFSAHGLRKAVSVFSDADDMEAFRKFSGSPAIRTTRLEYERAADTLERAGLEVWAAPLRRVFPAQNVEGPDRGARPRPISQARVLRDLVAAVRA